MVAVNVAQLLKAPTGETRAFEFEEPGEGLGPDLVLTAPVAGRVRLMRTARGILVTCEYHTRVQLDCARCLAPVDVPISSRIEEEALPSLNLRTGEWITPLPEERDLLRVDERNVLDLDDLIRQDLLVNLPLRPLCEPPCVGLCPRCGGDRSRGACVCPSEDVAPEEGLGSLGEALARELQRKQRGA